LHLARLTIGIALVAIAAFLTWYGGFVISLVFDEYQDSPDATYIAIGGTSLAVAAFFALAALLTLSRTRRPRGWLVLALIAAVASALPYTSMIGWPGYAVNATLALVAVGSALTFVLGGSRPPHCDPMRKSYPVPTRAEEPIQWT
jgi:peptidoglycan/LPS O-acetylase OafA/YrhL